jgi:rubrerythrin
MTTELPQGAPDTIGEAFARINGVANPTVDELKVMVLLEAAGQELYRASARGTDNPAVAAILEHNGREELAHAHRVSKAILAIGGEDFPPPAAQDNPYLAGPIPTMAITPEALRKQAQGEYAGEGLYERWAANIGNEEAARLFRLNGREETEHGDRLEQAAALLEA